MRTLYTIPKVCPLYLTDKGLKNEISADNVRYTINNPLPGAFSSVSTRPVANADQPGSSKEEKTEIVLTILY